MTAFTVAVCALLGLAVGSFLNVVIWRVPRGESIVRPASHCPHCERAIAPYDNVPLLSWLALRGRCRHCREPIPARYPIVEVATAALFAAIGARFAGSWALPAYLLLGASLLALSVIDLEHYRLPNAIVYPTAGAGVALFAVAAAATGDWAAFGRALLGGAAAFGLLLVVHLVSPRGMGFGDVKLAFVLGLFLGWLGWGEVLLGLFMGFLLGSVIGVALIAAGVRSRRDRIPFGPFLAAGALVVVFWGGRLLDLYQRHR